MKTILITGTSSGIGKATVRYFSERGWKVAATLRNPEKEQEMGQWPNVSLYRLDVTDEESVKLAVASVVADFGKLDVVCNNAGYGSIGIFEKASSEQVSRQFETNVIGAMHVIRAVLPHFRAQKAGTIINITSMGGQITFPIYSLYHGTKWALEGFSESLSFELRPLGIRVKCIEPGAIKTDFYSRSQDLFTNPAITDYERYEAVAMANTQKEGEKAEGPLVVAKKIFQAANDQSFRLRYAVGGQSPLLLFLRRILPNSVFFGLVRAVVEKGFKK